MKPASVTSGWSNGRMTFSSSIATPRQLSPIDRPLTVSAPSWIRPWPINWLTTAGTPPAR
jgi:hypothetical protein